MNNNPCTEMVEAILASDGNFSVELQTHIKQCDNCAALAASWDGLRNAKPIAAEVPPSLDFVVRNAARKAQARNKWMLPKWFYAISSAACAIMFAWLIVHSHQYESQRRYTTWTNSNNDQTMLILNSEVELNKVFTSIVSTEPKLDTPEMNEPDMDEIISDIQGLNSDNEFLNSLLIKNADAQLL